MSSQDRLLDELAARYPSGSTQLEVEIRGLKRKLDELEFSDIDEDEYCRTADKLEKRMKVDKENKKPRIYVCDICNLEFNRKNNLTRHVLTHSASFKCEICQKQFRRSDYLKKHQRKMHQGKSESLITCQHCNEKFTTYTGLFEHVTELHPLYATNKDQNQKGGRVPLAEKTLNNESNDAMSTSSGPTVERNNINQQQEPNRPYQQQNAIENTVQNRTIYPRKEEQYDLLTFLANSRNETVNFLTTRLKQHSIKWHLCVQIELVKEDAEGNVTATSSPHFRSLTYTTLNVDTFSEHDLNEALQKLSKSLENYLRESSGWTIKRVIHLEVLTVTYSPLGGSSYIPLPRTLKKSNCILNIENSDQKCFVYSVLASLHPTESQPELVSHYEKYTHQLDMRGIKFPVSICQLEKFESQNENISVNVFTYDQNEIIPLKITKHRGRLHHVNLLLLQNDKASHYCLIKNINQFLSRLSSRRHQVFVCNYCLHMFTKKSLLDEHISYCSPHGAQKVNLPNEDNNILEFKDYEKTLKVNYIIYADFETLNEKIDTCPTNPHEPSTTPTTLLTPCSFGYKVVCKDPKYTKPTVIYRGSDASERLIECLIKEKEEIEQKLQDVQPLQLTRDDYRVFYKTSECCICRKPFNDGEQRARHHDHFTGQFIGAAHMNCNFQCRQTKFIPIVFHGLKNFDAHCLCQSIGKFKDNKLKCIPQNMERYVSFSLDSLRFIDSYQFLPSSLETLVDNLIDKGSSQFPHLHQEFKNPDHSKLLLRKGVYPYDYMDDERKFNEIKLPPKDAFYSHIKREHITDEDYHHAITVFQSFACQNLGDYHDLYLKSDVLLLCDVFEQFRNMSLHHYELDPAHFYTSPGLSWQAMLKKTGVCLELMTDIDQVLFIEKGIRGGISQISNRYAKANNEFVPDYDPTKPKSWLSYIDANNLYGTIMAQEPLPTGLFRFLEHDEIVNFNVHTIPVDGSKGYILEVSLRYPEHLHDLHNDFPLAPESRHVADDELSSYAKRILNKLYGKDGGIPQRAHVTKLLTTLNDKEKYVVHYKNLKSTCN